MSVSLNRNPRKTLTAQFVKTVKQAGKYFDGNGLYLRVDANGSRFWVQRITIRGKRQELGLGSPLLIPLIEARAIALENRKLARMGGDPLEAKRAAQSVPSFAEAAKKVYEMHKPTWRNAKHAAQFISTLETYTFPSMGKLKVSDITASDVLSALSPIWIDKAETARRVRQRIGLVMKWAIAQGWRKDNPAENISQALPKHERTKNNRKALAYSDVQKCIETINASNAGLSTKLALEFLILTASRSGEARLAVWSEFNLEKKIWEIPAIRMKMKRPHRVPLSERAIEILNQAKVITDGQDFVFLGSKQGKPLSDMTLSKLVKQLGFDADVHGFRTSFRTWTQERMNYPNEVAEAALAHLSGDAVERAYARSDLFEKRRKMMDAWASYLAENQTSNVVRIG